MGQAAVSRTKTLDTAHRALEAVDTVRVALNQAVSDLDAVKRQIVDCRTDAAAVAKALAALTVKVDELAQAFEATNYTARMSAVEKKVAEARLDHVALHGRLHSLECRARAWNDLTFIGRLSWLLLGVRPA